MYQRRQNLRYIVSLIFLAIGISLIGAEPHPNILIITVDTLRYDYISCNNPKAPHTPNIDLLAKDGVNFINARSPVPITLPAHTCIMTGLYPPQTGVRDNGISALPDEIPTIASILLKNGYHTAAVIGSIALERRFGLSKGFEIYDDFIPGDFAERKATDVTRIAIEEAKSLKAPWFFWVHYFDPHYPYNPPEEFAKQYPDNSYAGEVAFTDSEVGRLLNSIDKKNTYIILTGDHGESLGEHGEDTHGVFIYDSTLRIPLIISSQDIKPGVNTESCSLIDIASTILSILKIPFSKQMNGKNLLGSSNPSPLYVESRLPMNSFHWSPLYGIILANKKYIKAPIEELYDIGKDKSEEKNLFNQSQKSSTSMKIAYKNLASIFPSSTNSKKPSYLSGLKSLGYLSSTPAPGGSCPDPKTRTSTLRKMETARGSKISGNSDKALKLWKDIVRDDSDNPTALIEYAMLLEERDDANSAIPLLKKAIKIAPHFTEAITNLGHCLVSINKADEAKACYEAALKDNPNIIEAINPLASYYLDKNKPDPAFSLLEGAASKGIANSSTYLLLGRIKLVQKDGKTAESNFEKALHLSKDPRKTLKIIADTYVIQGDLNKAIHYYEEGIRLFPDYPDNYLTLGTIFLQGEMPERALAYYKKALSLQLPQETRKNINEIVEGLSSQETSVQ